MDLYPYHLYPCHCGHRVAAEAWAAAPATDAIGAPACWAPLPPRCSPETEAGIKTHSSPSTSL